DFAPRDQPAVRELILSGMRERWGRRFDPTANPDTDDLWTSYIAKGGEIVVVEMDGAIIGTGTLLPEPGGGGRILRLSVEQRRRRQGDGRRIVGELIERAKRRQLDPLVVTTDTPWSDAVALYRSCGFIVVKQTKAVTHFSMSLTPCE